MLAERSLRENHSIRELLSVSYPDIPDPAGALSSTVLTGAQTWASSSYWGGLVRVAM